MCAQEVQQVPDQQAGRDHDGRLSHHVLRGTGGGCLLQPLIGHKIHRQLLQYYIQVLREQVYQVNPQARLLGTLKPSRIINPQTLKPRVLVMTCSQYSTLRQQHTTQHTTAAAHNTAHYGSSTQHSTLRQQ